MTASIYLLYHSIKITKKYTFSNRKQNLYERDNFLKMIASCDTNKKEENCNLCQNG